MSLSNLLIALHKYEYSMEELSSCLESQNYVSLVRKDAFYNGIIITIYGMFENYIDCVAKEYLTIVYSCNERTESQEIFTHNESDIDKMDKTSKTPLKDKLTDLYKFGIGDFLQSPNRHSNIEDSDEKIIQLLSSYIDIKTKDDYSNIDISFLLFHSGNMKSDAVFDLFNRIQIKELQTKLIEVSPFKTFIIDELGIEEPIIKKIQTERKSDVYLQLNRLVDERNIIAHQGKSDNKISFDELKKKTIPFLLLFADALFRSVCVFILKTFELKDECIFANKKFIDLYDNCIVCHSNEGKDIKVGDYFVIKNNNDRVIAKILTIEENHMSKDRTGTLISDFGFKVDSHINENNELLGYIGV